MRGAIADLFTQHEMHHDFGLAMLHSHYDLDPDFVMVHNSDDAGRDICRPERYCSHRTLYPYSFRLCASGFTPFEYSSRPAPPVHVPFFGELARLLRAHGLENLLGLVYLESPTSTWLEKMDVTGHGMISEVHLGDCNPEAEAYSTTEWKIIKSGRGAHLVSRKWCKELDHGGHERKN